VSQLQIIRQVDDGVPWGIDNIGSGQDCCSMSNILGLLNSTALGSARQATSVLMLMCTTALYRCPRVCGSELSHNNNWGSVPELHNRPKGSQQLRVDGGHLWVVSSLCLPMTSEQAEDFVLQL
jgi:hypothetical protein